MLKHVLLMMLLAPRSLVWGASDEAISFMELYAELQADASYNGLEADSTTRLQVLIEKLSEEQKKIGLTRERLEARINQSLRKAGITPVQLKPEDNFQGSGADSLYVNVNVASRAFTISIQFQRDVFYRSRGKWFNRMATTWDTSSTGIAPDADYILDRVADHVEVFCNEFLKANGK